MSYRKSRKNTALEQSHGNKQLNKLLHINVILEFVDPLSSSKNRDFNTHIHTHTHTQKEKKREREKKRKRTRKGKRK